MDDGGPGIDWESLTRLARDVALRAHAPYSNLRVGAAGLVDEPRRTVTGCNVESASYGLTLCAECGLISELHSSGGGRLIAASIVRADGGHLVPCGRCRQLLFEAGGPELLIASDDGPVPIVELLPTPFTPHDLPDPP